MPSGSGRDRLMNEDETPQGSGRARLKKTAATETGDQIMRLWKIYCAFATANLPG